MAKDVSITFHSDNCAGAGHPAINVKYRGPFPQVENASEENGSRAWDSVERTFWEDAAQIARECGYSNIFAEGRMGGWVVPYYQFGADGKQRFEYTGQNAERGYPRYPDVMEDAKERKNFLKFQRRILKLLAGVPAMLRAETEYFRDEDAREETQRIAELRAEQPSPLSIHYSI